MALVVKLKEKNIEHLLQEFHFTKENRRKVLMAANTARIIKKLKLKYLRPSQIYQLLKPLGLETILLIRSATSLKRVHERIDKFFKKYNNEKLHLTATDIQEVGIEPGQKLGIVLNNLLYQKIDGIVLTKNDELNMARKLTSLTIQEIFNYGTDG